MACSLSTMDVDQVCEWLDRQNFPTDVTASFRGEVYRNVESFS